MILLQGLFKTLGGKHVLHDLNLEIADGETIAVIGRSGIGKSVMLRHIVALLTPDRGRIVVLGKDLAELNTAELKSLRLRIGYLFQDGALLNWLSIEDNVALPLREHRLLAEREVRQRVHEVLGDVELHDAAKKFPTEVSGGMRKRAGLARALACRPEVVLYDEPTSGLDPISSNVINELILKQKSLGKITQVVVTHDMASAFMIADRIALLHGGRILASGTPEEFQESDDPAVRQFIHGEVRGPLASTEDPRAVTESDGDGEEQVERA